MLLKQVMRLLRRVENWVCITLALLEALYFLRAKQSRYLQEHGDDEHHSL